MSDKIHGFLLVAFVSFYSVLGFASSKTDDEEAVIAAMHKHSDSWSYGRAEDMAQSMHPNIAHKGLMNGKLMLSSYEQLVEWTKAREGKEPDQQEDYRVTVLSLDGEMASIKGETDTYVEYAHLMKDSSTKNWVIMNYIFKFKSKQST